MAVVYPSHEEILSNDFLEQYKNKQPNWGFNGLGYIVCKRTYNRKKKDGSIEEWWETIARCICGAQKIGACYTRKEAERLFNYVFNLKCSFSGRALWQLGTSTVDRFGANSLVNCLYTNLETIEDYLFVFENLMLGGGVGASVRKEHIYNFPKVKGPINIVNINSKDADFIVPDSREGWVELLRKVLESYFVTGKNFTYSCILIRKYGEPINGFGGTASGPDILIEGITNICKVLNNRIGKKIRSIDALDIYNIIASIVVAGNVRRSSEIALGDADDILFLRAKRWDLGNVPNWRAMSNNTIVADNFDYTSNEFWNGYNGNGEAYGLFNLKLCQTYGRLGEKIHDNCEGGNPCLPPWAIVLTPKGLRKLSDININDIIWSKEGWTKVINKWSTGVKKVYKFTTTAGTFYSTLEHRIVCNGEKVEVQNADGIDIISGPYNSNIKIIPEIVMDGLVIGDGTVHKASNNLVLLDIGYKDYDYFNSEISSLIIKHRPGINEAAYEIQSSITHQELPKTYDRCVPDRFKYGNADIVASFLRGMFSANGSICGGRVTLKTSSVKIRDDVMLMLSSLGIKSYFTSNKGQNVTFRNGTYKCKDSYDINIYADRDKFANIIGFIQEYKNESLSKVLTTNIKAKINYDIIETSLISEEEVFDITVDNSSHTFWCQNCDVSNCLEIGLADGETCNLAELFLNNIESQEELIDCAKLLYKTQKAICAMKYIHDKTNKIVHKNMRLGLGVTGICQSMHKIDWLDKCYKELRKFDKEWSKVRGWNESIKLTTIKPSGTLSLLSGSTPGIHPSFGQYYIRRIRISSIDPVLDYCKNKGYKIEFSERFDGSIDESTSIIQVPCMAPEGTILEKDMDAINQLELLKKMQTIWSDNAISITVYYSKEELPAIKDWLKENYKNCVKSVSFLLRQDHNFKQPPYEQITKEQYEEMCRNIKNTQSDNIGMGTLLENLECRLGACPVR